MLLLLFRCGSDLQPVDFYFLLMVELIFTFWCGSRLVPVQFSSLLQFHLISAFLLWVVFGSGRLHFAIVRVAFYFLAERNAFGVFRHTFLVWVSLGLAFCSCEKGLA